MKKRPCENCRYKNEPDACSYRNVPDVYEETNLCFTCKHYRCDDKGLEKQCCPNNNIISWYLVCPYNLGCHLRAPLLPLEIAAKRYKNEEN